jgi:site-specific DNA-cytosine methylase
MRTIDLFSCIGCHAIGFERAGLGTPIAMVEKREFRRSILADHFPGVPLFNDVETYEPERADLVFGGPPCQGTSVAAAIHGGRSGRTLWGDMLRVGLHARAEWIVVEQPPGHKTWEAQVCRDLSRADYHVAKFSFCACEVGAPYIRRRDYLLACTSLPRLEVAWKAGPRAIEEVARAANARGAWNTDKLGTLRVDARSAGEMERSQSEQRRERIEALGDSNPPEMAEVIGRCIAAAI